jgi:hypothetical protein
MNAKIIFIFVHLHPYTLGMIFIDGQFTKEICLLQTLLLFYLTYLENFLTCAIMERREFIMKLIHCGFTAKTRLIEYLSNV